MNAIISDEQLTGNLSSHEPPADSIASRRVRALLRPALVFPALLVVAGACGYPYIASRVATIRWIESHGGEVQTAHMGDWLPAWFGIPEGPYAFDAIDELQIRGADRFDLRRLSSFRELKVLNVEHTAVDYHPALRDFRNLVSVAMIDTNATDDLIADLHDCRKLWYLNLQGTAITDRGIGHLKGLPLTELYLGGTQVSDVGLPSLIGLPLTYLDLSGTRVTDAGVVRLGSLGLTGLSLNGTPVTDEVVPVLLKLPLQAVDLRRTKLTAAGVARLRAHPTLREVWMSDPIVNTDEPPSRVRVLFDRPTP